MTVTAADLARIAGISESSAYSWLAGVPFTQRRTKGRPLRLYAVDAVCRHLALKRVDHSDVIQALRALVPKEG